jgi:DNA polymerase (family 10)
MSLLKTPTVGVLFGGEFVPRRNALRDRWFLNGPHFQCLPLRTDEHPKRLPCRPQRNAGEVADLLEEIGRRAAFEGGNPYKAKAYVRAAGSLRRLIRPLDEVIRQGALQTIPGVGEAIARRIEALHRGETDAALARMLARLHAGLLGPLAVPGLRPAAILKLHEKLGISSLDDLAAGCRDGTVGKTKDLGSGLERKILQGLAIASEGKGGFA